MRAFLAGLKGYAGREDGQDVVEYALLAAFIAIVAAVILIQIAPLLRGIYLSMMDYLAQA